MNADIAGLRRLWQEAFGDPEEVLDAFFATGFSPNRYHCLRENDIPVSALYWFDCSLEGKKMAYIYAVATQKAYRGKGFARRLMAETCEILRSKGYAGAILVPFSQDLFAFYEKLGYRAACRVTEFSAQWADTPVKLREIDKEQYARLRRRYLPERAVVQEGKILDFLSTQAQFYEGEDFLLAAEKDTDRLIARELLGNAQAAGGILRALNLPQGQFRTPGAGRDFAVFRPLQPDCPEPVYFGLALD